MTLCSEISGNVQPKHVGYGLPCAKCRAYYAADLTVCPICGCGERVPANGEDVRRPHYITATPMTTGSQCHTNSVYEPAVRLEVANAEI